MVLSDESRPVDLPPANDEGLDEGVRETCPGPLPLSLPRDVLTPEDSTGEGSLIHYDFGSHCESALPVIPDADGGQPMITVHEFLQDVTARRKAGKKYGRRNRLGTVKLDAYNDHSEQCRTTSSMDLLPSTSNCPTETQTRNDRDDDDQRISVRHPTSGRRRVVYPEHLSRPRNCKVSHLRRKKRFAKSKPLAQRLFEADVFSSGSKGVAPPDPDQNLLQDHPAHTSTSSRRRPLQFITSLNLTPSLESRIYGKASRTTVNVTSCSSRAGSAADSEIQPVSEADDDDDDDSVPGSSDSLQDDRDRPVAAVATRSGGNVSHWSELGAARAIMRMGTRARARASPAAIVMRGPAGAGKRAFRMRPGGGKQSSAQVPHNPLEYVPLPLVLVDTASSRRIKATARKSPPSCTTAQAGAGARRGHAREDMYGYQNQFHLMSADDHAGGPRALGFR